MRQKRDPQRNLQDLKPNWSRARQLAEIDRILDAHPELCDLVADDLAPYRTPQKLPSRAGAKGMTAEQVLRGAILQATQAVGLPRPLGCHRRFRTAAELLPFRRPEDPDVQHAGRERQTHSRRDLEGDQHHAGAGGPGSQDREGPTDPDRYDRRGEHDPSSDRQPFDLGLRSRRHAPDGRL